METFLPDIALLQQFALTSQMIYVLKQGGLNTPGVGIAGSENPGKQLPQLTSNSDVMHTLETGHPP